MSNVNIIHVDVSGQLFLRVFFSSFVFKYTCVAFFISKKKGYLTLNLKEVKMNPTSNDFFFHNMATCCVLSHSINIEA